MTETRAYDFTDGEQPPMASPLSPPLSPVRFSNLKHMAASPAHYADKLKRGVKETKSILLGSAVDAVTFDNKKIAVFIGPTRRGKVWDEFRQTYAGSLILNENEYAAAMGMARSLRRNTAAMNMLDGERQTFLSWDMAGNGTLRRCNGTPDVFRVNRVVELKTGRTSNPNYFPYDARKFAYHAQLDWYRNALALLSRCSPTATCHIVAVESSPPYPVTVFDLSERTLLEGRKLWRGWFEQLLVCEASNSFPEYTQTSVPWDVPDTDTLTLQIDGEDVEV